ncbi:LPP protein, partial [Regulus satrapa]|nr:LPP protein [Regulus satrapa]
MSHPSWLPPKSTNEPVGHVTARMETTHTFGTPSISVSTQQTPKKFAPVVAPKPKYNPYKQPGGDGDFLPPPPPPVDDLGNITSSQGAFPPPPPLDDATYNVQVNPGGKTLEERRSSLDAEIDSLTSILADLESSSPYKPRTQQGSGTSSSSAATTTPNQPPLTATKKSTAKGPGQPAPIPVTPVGTLKPQPVPASYATASTPSRPAFNVQVSGWTVMTGPRDTTGPPSVFVLSLTHPPPTFALGEDPSLPPCHCCPPLTVILKEFGANPSKLGRKVQTQWISLGFRSCYRDGLKHLAPNMPLVCWKQSFNCGHHPNCSISGQQLHSAASKPLPCLLFGGVTKRMPWRCQFGYPSSGPASSTPAFRPEDELEHLTKKMLYDMENPPSDDYFGRCARCGENVVGEGTGCTAMDQVFHVDCFTCITCSSKLRGQPFYAVEKKAYCEPCYINTLEQCSVCAKPIMERILRATGKAYHPHCFTCVMCHRSLDGIPFTVDAGGNIHCIEDFHKKFAPRCSVCKEPIMPAPGQEETVRIVALDRDFHVQCYRCEDCGGLLSEGDNQGCYPLDGHILCKTCNSARIQALTAKASTDL